MSEIEDAVGAWPLAPAAKPCDSCAASAAILHCRACAAFLCACCDGRVHGAGGRAVAVPHGRVWMCEVCEQAPAAVTCKADAASLCASCDADIHSANPLAGRHDRVPVTPFYEPVVSVIRHSASSSSQEEVKPKLTDFFFPEVEVGVDPFLDVDYSPPTNTSFGLIPTASTTTATTTDSVVPVKGKTDDASSLPFLTSSSSFDFDRHPPKNGCYSFTLTNASLNQSMSSPLLDVGVVPNGTNMCFSADYCGIEAAASSTAAAGMDREARVLRYREKRKNRKFEKTIRYASRKAYAESRPRIKGRFAKRTESGVEVGRIYSSAVALMAADSGFGVVPSF